MLPRKYYIFHNACAEMCLYIPKMGEYTVLKRSLQNEYKNVTAT